MSSNTLNTLHNSRQTLDSEKPTSFLDGSVQESESFGAIRSTPVGVSEKSLSQAELNEAYRYCRDVSAKHAKTFYFATHFLPQSKRTSVFAVYALCRYVDDLIDRSEDKLTLKQLTKEKIIALIDQWKADLQSCYKGEVIRNPIMLAWHDTLKTYHIPINLPLELIEGVCMDLSFKGYDTFEELYIYCYKVASVVGLMTSEIFGYRDKAALEHAIELGIAMQLTNILRDVGEDAEKGRIYIPKEDLRRFGYTESELMRGVINDQFIALMKFEIERARQFYQMADKGIHLLSKDSQTAVALSRINYGKILNTIERNHYDVFNKRAYVSFLGKLMPIPGLWFKSKF
ncbi:MAG: phytoene/squalene synthase family protein [Chloroherpetonaceae bacterium]|nr:phytoene/squalene synthase family protein [Chloroherpetonaceae bacterium]